MSWRHWLSLAVGAVAPLLAARAAHAAPPPPACNTLPNPVYVESGDTQEPLLKALGRKLRDSKTPMTIVYNTTGSCTLIQDMYTPNPMTVNLKYVPSSLEDANWDPSQPSLPCTNTSQAIDVAISALFVQSCNPSPPPAPLGLITGPIQGYGYIVPKAAQQKAITAEEAYEAFGRGKNAAVTPWTDETYYQIRPVTKSTLLTLAANARLDASKWLGNKLDKSTDVLNAVAQATAVEQTIGILGIEVYDVNRDKINLLAYRAYDQRYAYYPDSTSTSFDKRNLRDGHYLPWSPTVYITAVDAQKVPTNPNVKRLMDLVLGTTATDDVDGLAQVIAKGLVPDCAMKVSRTADGGDLSLYTPAQPCGCYYESKVPGATGTPAGCTTCTDDSTCNGGKCRHGFCEAR